MKKKLKDMTLIELKEEARPILEREEKERRNRIKSFLRALSIKVEGGYGMSDIVYFCLNCRNFMGWCDCCEPPGCSLSPENRDKLEDVYLQLYKGTVWDKIPQYQIPLKMIKNFARQAVKKVLPQSSLSFEPPRCPTCEDRQYEHECV